MREHNSLLSGRLARIAGVPALVAVAGLLGGCSLFNRGVVQQQPSSIDIQSEDGSGSINLNDGTVSFEGSDESGDSSFTFGSTQLPEGWPASLPTPDNATIVTSIKTSEDGETNYSASFTSSQSAEAALSDLKNKFQSSGWSVEGDYSTTFGGSISAGFTASQGANDASVIIGSDASNPGQISITIVGNFAQ